jgi:hypothetical protein
MLVDSQVDWPAITMVDRSGSGIGREQNLEASRKAHGGGVAQEEAA